MSIRLTILIKPQGKEVAIGGYFHLLVVLFQYLKKLFYSLKCLESNLTVKENETRWFTVCPSEQKKKEQHVLLNKEPVLVNG